MENSQKHSFLWPAHHDHNHDPSAVNCLPYQNFWLGPVGLHTAGVDPHLDLPGCSCAYLPCLWLVMETGALAKEHGNFLHHFHRVLYHFLHQRTGILYRVGRVAWILAVTAGFQPRITALVLLYFSSSSHVRVPASPRHDHRFRHWLKA